MVRRAFAIVLLVTAVCVAAGEDKDPIKEKLFAAKVAYDKEMRQFRKQVEDWLDKREETARKSGDKKGLDQAKEERKSYDETGDLPKSTPTALQQKQSQAKKKLEAAYAEAIKAYTKAKKDELASAVEKEWDSFGLKAGIANLLALVDTKTHTVAGEWKKDGTALVGTSEDSWSVLQLPYEPGEEYDLELVCRRTKGDNCLTLGLVAGGRQFTIFIDGFASRGYETGFELLDNKLVTTFKGPVLKADTDSKIVCSVRTDKIDLLVGGKSITSFKGDFARLSLHGAHRTPNAKTLFLRLGGTKGSFQFERIVVTPVKGKGTILK